MDPQNLSVRLSIILVLKLIIQYRSNLISGVLTRFSRALCFYFLIAQKIRALYSRAKTQIFGFLKNDSFDFFKISYSDLLSEHLQYISYSFPPGKPRKGGLYEHLFLISCFSRHPLIWSHLNSIYGVLTTSFIEEPKCDILVFLKRVVTDFFKLNSRISQVSTMCRPFYCL